MKPFKRPLITLLCAIIAISSMSVSAGAKGLCDTNKKMNCFNPCVNASDKTKQDINCNWNVILKQLTKGNCINAPSFCKSNCSLNAADAAKNCTANKCDAKTCAANKCDTKNCAACKCDAKTCAANKCDTKTCTAKPAASKPVTSKPITSKPETPKTEVPKTEAPKPVTSKPETPKPTTNEVAMADYAKEVVRLVNEERAAAGLAALKVDVNVQKAAQVRAEEQPVLFSHTRPNGTSCFTALNEAGASYRGAGENIAYGQRSPEEVMNGWMNSSGHRANIMNPNFKNIGVGFYKGSNGTLYWSQMFTY